MHISENVSIKSCHIFKKNKNGHFIFGFFWIRSVQNGSNLQIRWTDISNSRIQARMAWFLVIYKLTTNVGSCVPLLSLCHCFLLLVLLYLFLFALNPLWNFVYCRTNVSRAEVMCLVPNSRLTCSDQRKSKYKDPI